MHRRIRSSLRGILCLTTVLAVAAACGKKDRATRDTSGVSTGTIDAAGPTVRVTTVDLGKSIGADKKIKDGESSFSPRDTVYAVVTTEGSGSNQAIVTRWLGPNGQTVQELREVISPTGEAVTEFHIAQPSGLPKGKYMVHVLLNGTQVEAKDFEVK
jgi:hypothetical protein